MEATDSINPIKATVYISPESTVQHISCEKAFSKLDSKEKLYSYYFSRACWSGCKICYFQRSFESPALFFLFYKIFFMETVQEIKELLLKNGFDENDVKNIFVYIGAFFQNCGNYLSFGDTKFIPKISKEKFIAFIKLTRAYKSNKESFEDIWLNVQQELFEFKQPYYEIGLPDENALSSYYSTNITRSDTEFIKEFLKNHDISSLNTRVIKFAADYDVNFEVRVASVEISSQTYEFQGKKIVIQKGDFSPFLQDVADFLKQALPFCENSIQNEMIQAYIDHFKTGDMNLHKESQKLWIQDKGPIIETNIGFIETYLDPLKNRAEWEGFVAIVDKEKSKILSSLVENVPKILPLLPWPQEFEVEVFKQPDFTSLEVLSFASSGTPIGINIPNYDDIRQNYGFKNVDLGNAYGEMKPERVLFTEENLKQLYVKYHQESLFVIVALHELLGHGTGKLFAKNADGTFNFDYGKAINPLTNVLITTFYDHGETWHSKFGDLSGAYEECKADAVAIYLSTFEEIMDLLLPNYTKEQKEEILICCWYDVIYGAVRGLKEFSPESMKWGQAHMSGNFAILKVMMEADPTFVILKENESNDNLKIEFDSNKIRSVGRKAVGEFLKVIILNFRY